MQFRNVKECVLSSISLVISIVCLSYSSNFSLSKEGRKVDIDDLGMVILSASKRWNRKVVSRCSASRHSSWFNCFRSVHSNFRLATIILWKIFKKILTFPCGSDLAVAIDLYTYHCSLRHFLFSMLVKKLKWLNFIWRTLSFCHSKNCPF